MVGSFYLKSYIGWEVLIVHFSSGYVDYINPFERITGEEKKSEPWYQTHP